MLEGEAVGRDGVERAPRRVRQSGIELGRGRGAGRAGPRAVDQRHRVVLQVVRRRARPLVVERHGAALLEAPLGGRDGAVDAARARRRGRQDARRGGIEAGRDLDDQRHAPPSRAVVAEGRVLGAADVAVAGERRAVVAHLRAVEHAEAARRGGVDERAVAGVDRQAPQLRRRRRIRHRGREVRLQAGRSEPGRQQIVGGVVMGGGGDVDQERRLDARVRVVRAVAAGDQRGAEQGAGQRGRATGRQGGVVHGISSNLFWPVGWARADSPACGVRARTGFARADSFIVVRR